MSRHVRDLPSALVSSIHRALAPSPDDRFATVSDLVDAILPFAGRQTTPLRSTIQFARAHTTGAFNAKVVIPESEAQARFSLQPSAPDSKRRDRRTRLRGLTVVGSILLAAIGLVVSGNWQARQQGPPASSSPLSATVEYHRIETEAPKPSSTIEAPNQPSVPLASSNHNADENPSKTVTRPASRRRTNLSGRGQGIEPINMQSHPESGLTLPKASPERDTYAASERPERTSDTDATDAIVDADKVIPPEHSVSPTPQKRTTKRSGLDFDL